MDTIEKFKSFVKENPKLLKHVQNGSMTWQKFYEMYDMYGEDSNVWDNYLKDKTEDITASLGIFEMLKKLDLDSIQNGVNSMQRVVELFQDMVKKNNKDKAPDIKPRPIYKHFEDWYYPFNLK